MFKKFLMFSLVLVIFGLTLNTGLALAKSNDRPNRTYRGEIDMSRDSMPEADGYYKIKNHSDMELRVFVYQAGSSRVSKPVLQCKLSDPDSTSVVEGAGWKLPSTWTYRLNSNSVPSSVGSSNFSTITSKAYSTWTSAINNAVTIKKGRDTFTNKANLDGQNIITFGNAPSTALAVTYVWATNGVATEIDTIINSNFSWYWSNSNTCAYQNVYDVQDILTHELGHSMGLNDEYDTTYVDNTMFGYGSMTETKKDTLTTGDIIGVKSLY